MKKTCLFLGFVVLLTVTAATANAGSAVVLRGDVPFDFYVENRLLPAGEYIFEMGRIGDATTNNVTVRSADGKIAAFVTTRPGFRQEMVSGQLSFSSYEGKFYLASVECPGYKADLRKTAPMNQSEVVQVATVLPVK
ncbi:MAG: hypothetical protein JW793_15455 [Acidobacteria bacterium]|nr:hypothetical protein [Acidobacteriota bacterium]